ncbi:hypothetical protein METBIDRAFT_76611 [Metschnikowia bicuspidata var. bicuspidata NRRL YB-4993]|uniref:Cyclin N-terminal domain-containing protein n=1 Tax=Metschnikowia bicuspidata var. bicuspidata NRRL YB-4993 TaxID=869754 RepID=A0A1A0HIB1_9ASCO|nr:hypothetical protein METBIDRAFT_76611 [Metschnikowia bicuspidata var. bicuspidata NRRL YB-4993]OBA23622.1 hypothetical protein METBIDRAFT_76611 [Metschnikowia bicuspidata var. bicuspidata NRRL YB-4993]
MLTPDNSISPKQLIDLPARDQGTPHTPAENYLPNNLKYYNEHLSESQFNSILINCALRLLKLSYPKEEDFEEHKLRFFIVELLRRSKTTTQSLQICCYYLFKIINKPQRPVQLCPKKLFLGMLILASKFNQDHNYSFKTWLKICGCKQDDDSSSLNLKRLKYSENHCLLLLNYELYINNVKYENWCNVLLIFGYEFISLHHVGLGVLTWCTTNENAQKLCRWKRFLERMDDNLLREIKVQFKQYYANHIGTKVVTTPLPEVNLLFKKRSLDAEATPHKRVCI